MSLSSRPAPVSVGLTSRLVAALTSARFEWSTEDQLQRDVAAVLTRAGLPFQRHMRFGHRRVNFALWDGHGGCVVLELRMGAPEKGLHNMLGRIAEDRTVRGFVVASPHERVMRMPTESFGKPLQRVQLKGWA